MISRLLIANRGEIAVRIARTAHLLGIDTVGVYSEPDANALHTDVVDRAIALGGSSPADSYLRGEAIIDAALANGADAIHPGYGFLAENPHFAEQVIAAGLIWVGPTPDQIRLLGDKVKAKDAALAAGVPTVPIIDATPESVPTDVAMPALVKAAAGGGGRGMRVVRDASELSEAVEAASREAESAFGDGRVFIEPYIEHGRHVEVQIMGDALGNVIHLGERECSIQRRNQKVIEESPSPGINDETRSALWSGAVALANHVGYQNAGTVEFLVGSDGTVNFLEVNTRLQVEHPVTEAVTGLDMVALQLMVAAGEPLPLTQDQVSFHGHAIEVRLVAEDPAAGWLPAIGEIRSFDIGEGVRVDTGIRAGAVVSPDYDSLLAKVIAHSEDRATTARLMARALRTSNVTGLKTNLETLQAIMQESDFSDGATPTSYLDDHPDVLDPAGPTGEDRMALLLGAVFATEYRDRQDDPVTGFAPSGWRNLPTTGQRQTWSDGHTSFDVEYFMGSDTAVALVGAFPAPTEDGTLANDDRRRVDVRLPARSSVQQVIELDGQRHVVTTDVEGTHVHTHSRAGTVSWSLVPRFEVPESGNLGGGPLSPLPGTVIAVHVSAGDVVAQGALLMVVEAMKMEHRITAGADATVAEVRFSEGDRVDTGDLLVRLEAATETGSQGGDGG